ncbi:MAG: hypothetical protein DRI56_08150 [Chloroflexota bacterium]|nr:MAG: hypothetical protein DRI56_08150 [Chloroflexota bacterium]
MKMLICLRSDKYLHPPILLGGLIAKNVGFDIEVLVVVTPQGYVENGESVLDQVSQDLRGLPLTTSLKQGKPAKIIRKHIQQGEHSLLIFNKNRIQQDAFGMAAMKAFWKCYDFPILITENAKPQVKNILLCTGGRNEYLLEYGAKFAQAMGANLTLLHVAAGTVPTMYTGLNEFDETVSAVLQADTPIARYLRHAADVLAKHNVNTEVKIRHGVPTDELVRETQLENYDLVIIGHTHAREGLKEWLLGNLTAKIINRVELPVLVVSETLKRKK